MTDAELIARMLDGGVLAGRMIADRIEALRAALTAALARADAAEAALAAADPLADPRVQALVEALRGFMSKVDTACLVERDHPQAEFADAWRDAYAIIAEIEGEKT
jgi:hypothetical protein